MTHNLQTMIKEFDDSLTRMDGEKDIQKRILERAHGNLGINPTVFKIAAAAYHKDKLSDTLRLLNMQTDLIEGLLEQDNDA